MEKMDTILFPYKYACFTRHLEHALIGRKQYWDSSITKIQTAIFETATKRSNLKLLGDIKGVDLIAKELRKHVRCCWNYKMVF